MDFLVTQANTVLICLIYSELWFFCPLQTIALEELHSQTHWFTSWLVSPWPLSRHPPGFQSSDLSPQGLVFQGQLRNKTGQSPRSASLPGAGLWRGNAILLGTAFLPDYVIWALIFLLCCWIPLEQYYIEFQIFLNSFWKQWRYTVRVPRAGL